MKVIELYAENIKRIVAVKIRPDGNFVQITGDNEQGKTSVLDALWWAFSGEAEIQPMPIRLGQDKGKVQVDLGELIVTRRFVKRETGYTSTLEIRNKEGFKASSPQALLDKAVGRLAMDPLAFLNAKPAEQLLQIRKLVKGFDFDKNDAARKEAFDSRTEIGRDIRKLEGQRVAFNDLPPAVEDWQDPVEILQKQQAAADSNRKLEEEKRRRDGLRQQLTDQMAHVEEIQRQLVSLKDQVKELQGRIESGEKMLVEQSAVCDQLEGVVKDLPELPAPLDLKVFEEELAEVQRKNKTAERAKARDAIEAELVVLKVGYDKLTKALDDNKALEATKIAEAQLPIEGLGFSDLGVTIKGVPLEQASAAQQLKLSASIAMAQNPNLRVMRIKDGSLLDAKSLALVEEIANTNDYQIWIERVAGEADVGVVISEGRVKGQELEPEKEKQQPASAVASEAPAAN